MNIVENITDSSPQTMNIVLPDGSTVTWALTYRPNQGGWFYDISWDGINPPWVCNGNRLVTSPNILRQYRGFINFGLTVTTVDNGEPIGQSDFVNGYATVLLLDETDIANIESAYYPGLP